MCNSPFFIDSRTQRGREWMDKQKKKKSVNAKTRKSLPKLPVLETMVNVVCVWCVCNGAIYRSRLGDDLKTQRRKSKQS